MNTGEIIEGGVIGGAFIILIEVFLAFVVPITVYLYFSVLVLLLGGGLAGRMIGMHDHKNEAALAGILAGLVYVVMGLLVIFPAIYGTYNFTLIILATLAVAAFGTILGAVGGFLGHSLKHRGRDTKAAKRRSR
jgi:hypothetical protein